MGNFLFLISSTVAVLVSLFGRSTAATLKIVEAGRPMPWRSVGPLSSSEVLCPADLYPSFTIQCNPSAKADFVIFYLNGAMFRKEAFPPYVLTGDAEGLANAWNGRPSVANIRCDVNNGESVTTNLRFSCSGSSEPSGPGPAVSPSPSPKGSGPTMGSGDSPCVKINAKRYLSKSGPWVVDGGGMTYKKGNMNRKTTGAGVDNLVYEFVAPKTSRYAFTLDMLTRGAVDHNDVWVEFPAGGWRLRRDSSTINSQGWTKAYHNKNGRATQAFSVDFNAHSFSTGDVLVKGRKYVVKLGGRSTRVTIYRLIFFPCSKGECVVGGLWNRKLFQCLG